MHVAWGRLFTLGEVERANVGRSTFYTHFTDKDDLFVNQLDRLMDLLGQHIRQERAEANPYFPS